MKVNTNHLYEKAHHHTLKLMGCRFSFSAIHLDSDVAWTGIRAAVDEVKRIENLISSWKKESETSRINKNAGGQPIQVSEELFNLINRCIKVSNLTCGAFDISGEVSRLIWNFKERDEVAISASDVALAQKLINYKHIILNNENRTVQLKETGMFIGFGGIGKGYAAQRCQEIMVSRGIMRGLINASGDIYCWGTPPKDDFWHVTIPHPEITTKALLDVNIDKGSIVTSGNYENFVLVNGERYSHIVDPRRGQPSKEVNCVTVTNPLPEFADALATALSVMDLDDGLSLVNKLPHTECVIVDNENKEYYSTNLLKQKNEFQA